MNTETAYVINNLKENGFSIIICGNAAFAEMGNTLILVWDEDDGSNEPSFGYCVFNDNCNIGKVNNLSFDSPYHCLWTGKPIGNHIKSIEDFNALVEKKLGV